MHGRLAFCTLVGLVGLVAGAAAQATRELTPADVMETTSILQNQELPGHSIDESFSSPDGRRYVIRTAHGDVRRNGVWVDFWTGSLESLATATPKRCAHLFTTGLGSRGDALGANLDPISANLVKWSSNHEIAFLWADRREVRQVMAVDLDSCRHRQLTHGKTSVTTFAVGTAHRLLINAKRSPPTNRAFRWQDGFTLPDSASGWSVLRDEIGDRSFANIESETVWSIESASGRRPIKMMGLTVDATNPVLRPLYLSPDGRYAVTYSGVQAMPDAWRAYADPFLQQMFTVNIDRPGIIPVMFAVFDIKSASSHPLWTAPCGTRTVLAFSPDSRLALMAPTFLPQPNDEPAGLAGHAAAVVDVRSGRYEELPIDLGRRSVARLSWITPERVAIRSLDLVTNDVRVEQFRRAQSHWVADMEPAVIPAPATIRLEVRQSLNDPPTLWAMAPDGRERKLMDPDPQLRHSFKLGRVERRSGTLSNGHPWLAQLIYPADYRPGTKYPLVIQSLYGQPWAEEEYTLHGAWGGRGMGLGPSQYPSYPGQLLASRGIAVLQLELLHASQAFGEGAEHQVLFESLAEELSSEGLVDRKRIALAGFSLNGYWVDYTLSHSDFPFAAALTADNYDAGYIASALSDWWSFDVEANGAPAFGSGLQTWLLQTPGFNAEHIHTPLRMIGQAMGAMAYLMGQWELYSRLRHLDRPVEIAVMPDINRHPSHNTQNPRQILFIQESSLDWLTFWLTGREDPSPSKRDQYVRWHRLRNMQVSSGGPAP